MRKLLIVDEHRYYRTPDGKIWIPSQNDYSFWQRYLNVFDKIKVVSRIEEVDSVPSQMLLSSGENVEFAAITNYIGPYEYVKNLISVKRQLSKVYDDCSHAIFRLPSELAFNILPNYLKSNKPFGIEVLIDPWDALAPNATKSIVGPIVRMRWYKLVKKYCMLANGVAYVTKEALQKRYPCIALMDTTDPLRYFTSNYSSLEMRKDYLSSWKNYRDKNKFIISHVGTMHNYVKGQDVLLKAIKRVRDKGYNVEVNFVGDGRIKQEFVKLSSDLGLTPFVRFIGHVNGSEAVREHLLQSDLFVFPTKAEGLPRVVIEAMACGLPCISTPVNGTPELITHDFLVDPNDVEGFSQKMQWLISKPDLMESISKRNIEVASEYTSEKLQIRRTDFYSKLCSLDVRKD
jgi:L-malate glycosyltransferase